MVFPDERLTLLQLETGQGWACNMRLQQASTTLADSYRATRLFTFASPRKRPRDENG